MPEPATLPTMAAKDNRLLVSEFVEQVFNAGDLSAIERYYAQPTAQEVRRHVEELLSAFGEVRVEIDELVAEGDRVAARLTITGRHTGTFAGLPATGRRVTYSSFRFYRIEDGKIVATHAMQDRLGLLQQIGATLTGAHDVHWAASATASRPQD